MSFRGWLAYARTVLGRAWASTGRLAWSKLAFGVYMAVLVAVFTWWYAADVAWPYSLPLVLAAVVSAGLVTLALFFVDSLLAAPYALHVKQAQAAVAAAQACAVETARLTGELAAARAALDERAQRRAIRDALGRFLSDGTALQARILAGSTPLNDEVGRWLGPLYEYVRETLGAAALAILQSDAGLDGYMPLDAAGRPIMDARRITWSAVDARCTRIRQLLDDTR
jgi:hypothetical protein